MAVVSNSSTTYSTFLKVYGGEVVNAYNAATIIAPLVKKRVISSGKSASFPTFTRERAKLHVPGEDVFVGTGSAYASDVTQGEKIITIEKAIIAPQFVDDMDQAMTDYNIHSELAEQAGEALAFAHEAMLIGAIGAFATGTAEVVTGDHPTASANGAALASGIGNIAAKMDAAFVPPTGRYMIVTPTVFYALMDADGVISSDFNTTGDRATARNLKYMGFEILNSQVLNAFANEPTADIVGAGGPLELGGAYAAQTRSDMSFNASKLMGMAFHKDSVASVILKGVQTEVNYIPERLGHLLNAKQGLGVGNLRPESCFKLNSTS